MTHRIITVATAIAALVGPLGASAQQWGQSPRFDTPPSWRSYPESPARTCRRDAETGKRDCRTLEAWSKIDARRAAEPDLPRNR